MHYYCFAVEPKKTHPKFWEIQAGYAHVIVRDESDDSEAIARREVDRMGMEIQELQEARQIPIERYEMMPPEAQDALRVHPVFAEIVAYETGGGPTKPPPLFSDEDENT